MAINNCCAGGREKSLRAIKKKWMETGAQEGIQRESATIPGTYLQLVQSSSVRTFSTSSFSRLTDPIDTLLYRLPTSPDSTVLCSPESLRVKLSNDVLVIFRVSLVCSWKYTCSNVHENRSKYDARPPRNAHNGFTWNGVNNKLGRICPSELSRIIRIAKIRIKNL